MLVSKEKEWFPEISAALQSEMVKQAETPFGIIALKYKGKRWPETELAGIDPNIPVRQVHFPHLGTVLFILEGQHLSGTHFFAIALHHRLNSFELDHGPIIVAYVQPNESAEEVIADVLRQIEQEPDGTHPIRIFNKSPHKMRPLLVVDNDETVGEFLTTRLGMKGYHVHLARNGQEGLEKFEHLAPDMVITDLALPVMDGFQLLKSIRRKSKGKSKVMVLTNKRLEQVVRRCFELGADDVLMKPFSPLELEARIRRLFSLNRQP